jgi:hypothetical protein
LLAQQALAQQSLVLEPQPLSQQVGVAGAQQGTCFCT